MGIHTPYLAASFFVIGLTGFMSFGVMGPMLWGRGQQDAVLLVAVVFGVFRTFALIYSSVKHRSGRILERAENLIVDVGVPAPPAPPAPLEATGEASDRAACDNGESALPDAASAGARIEAKDGDEAVDAGVGQGRGGSGSADEGGVCGDVGCADGPRVDGPRRRRAAPPR